jgi:hypothetical protein
LLFIWACHFSFLNFFKLRASREKIKFRSNSPPSNY